MIVKGAHGYRKRAEIEQWVIVPLIMIRSENLAISARKYLHNLLAGQRRIRSSTLKVNLDRHTLATV
jgi:hypothetical protein